MINLTERNKAMSRFAKPIGYIDGRPIFSMFGGDSVTDTYRGGYQTLGDVVNVTNDGVDLNALWAGVSGHNGDYNESRGRLVQLLTFPVTNIIETVPQVGEASFEMASSLASRRLRS